MFRSNSTEPASAPCLSKLEPFNSPGLIPNKAKSMANKIEDFPEPTSPTSKVEPSGNFIS